MKLDKKLGIAVIFIILALISISTVVAFTIKYPDLSGLKNAFSIKVIINAIIIGSAFYFALPLLKVELKSTQAITAALILIGIVSIAIAVNMGPDKYIWQKETFSGIKDYLFGSEKNGKAGILTYSRIGIFIGAAAIFHWFFTFLKVGAEKAKINMVLAIVIGAHLARSGITSTQLIQISEVIAMYIIYNNLQATVKNKTWAFVMSFLLVEYVAYILSGKGIVMGTAASAWGAVSGISAAKWPILIIIGAMVLTGGGALGVGALVNWARKGEEGTLRKGLGKSLSYLIEYWGKQALKRIKGLKRANWKDPIKEGQDPRVISELTLEIGRQESYIGRFKTYNKYWDIVTEGRKRVNALLKEIPSEFADYYELKRQKHAFEHGGMNVKEIFITHPVLEGDNITEPSRLMARKYDGTVVPFEEIPHFGWRRLDKMMTQLSAQLTALNKIKDDVREKVKRFVIITRYKHVNTIISSEEVWERLPTETQEDIYHSRQNTANTFWNTEITMLNQSIQSLEKLREAQKKRDDELEGYQKTYSEIIALMADVYSNANPALVSKYPHTYVIKAPPEGGAYDMVEVEVSGGGTVMVPRIEELGYWEGFVFDVDKLERMGYRILRPDVFFMLVNRHWDNYHDDLKDGRWHPYSRTLGDYRLAMHRRIYNDKKVKNWFGPPTHENFAYDKQAVQFKHFGSLHYYDHSPVYGSSEKVLTLRDNDPVTGRPIHQILGVAPSDDVAYAETITRGRWKGQFKLRRNKGHKWTTDKEKGIPVKKYIPRPDGEEPKDAHSSTKGFSYYLWDLLGFEYANADLARNWFLNRKNELVTPDVSGEQWGVGVVKKE